MTCGQIGCVRRGSWEHGLAFDGTISLIEPPTRYWVQLEADIRGVEPSMAPLSQIGGRTFAMIDDGYSIEAIDNEHAILHLYSSYRITTGINPYAGLWLDALLRDIQGYILRVEKARSEAQAK